MYAAHWAVGRGYETVLLNIRPEQYSMMFHHQNAKWTELQAEALGLEYHYIDAAGEEWEEKVEAELARLRAEAIVSGAVASNYQKARLDRVAKKLCIESHAPLWHADSRIFWEMVRTMEIYITGVAAEGMTRDMLGKRLTWEFRHPRYVHLFFEGGEAETFVADAPLFRKRILIDEWDIHWDGIRGSAEIKSARLVEKVEK